MNPKMPATHTPGPWAWVREHARGDGIDGPERMPVAWVAVDCRNSDEYQANARLIAAAPELLGALAVMTDHYVRLVESGDCGSWNPDDEEPVKFARAAIRRARGQ